VASNAETKAADAAAAASAGQTWENMGTKLKELASNVGQFAQHLSTDWKGSAGEAAVETLRKLQSSAESASATFTEIGQAVAAQSKSLGSLLSSFEATSTQVKTELENAIKSATVALAKIPGGGEVEKLLAEAAQRLASLPQ
jgi:phage-related protein